MNMESSPNLHKQCLVCASSRLDVLPKYEKHHLVRCRDCSFVFAQAIPSDEELASYYQNYGSGYREWISPITVKRYHELLDHFELYRSSGNMLDVGCGSGHFLSTAQTRGWNVYGTEFSGKKVEACRAKGIQMSQGILDPANYTEAMFDVITSFEVLEHIYAPKSEIRKFHDLLRPGGLVYCTTPNFNALNRFQLGPEFSIFCYPEHLGYYTPKTFKRVFVESGFKCLKIESTGFSISRAKPSGTAPQVISGEASLDEVARKRIEGSVLLRLLKKAANRVLSHTGTGVALKGYFAKR